MKKKAAEWNVEEEEQGAQDDDEEDEEAEASFTKETMISKEAREIKERGAQDNNNARNQRLLVVVKDM
jgi:hypothetical protein